METSHDLWHCQGNDELPNVTTPATCSSSLRNSQRFSWKTGRSQTLGGIFLDAEIGRSQNQNKAKQKANATNVIKCRKCWYIVVVSLSFTSPACTLPNPRHHCHWVAPTPTPRPHVRTWWQVVTSDNEIHETFETTQTIWKLSDTSSLLLTFCGSACCTTKAGGNGTCLSHDLHEFLWPTAHHHWKHGKHGVRISGFIVDKFNSLYNQYDLVCSKNVCHELSWMLMPLQQVQHRPEKACMVPRSIRTFAPSLVHGPHPDDVNLRSCKLIKLIRLLWF